MDRVFEQVRVGGDRNFGYLLGDRGAGEALLVDPSFDPEGLVARARAQGLRVVGILNTHGHRDHACGNERAQALTVAPVLGGPGHPGPLDRVLEEGEVLTFGRERLEVRRVPGHCPDHLAFRVAAWEVALTGDLLFVGKVGGTANEAEGCEEWESLQRLLRLWPSGTAVWPGHDYGARPSSTLAWEQATNPFLRCANVADFLALKADWPAFKARHGLR